jgi:uncharacterized protein YjbI with pentapeptide repeats
MGALAGVNGVMAGGIFWMGTLVLAFMLAIGIAVAGQSIRAGAVMVGMVGILMICSSLVGSTITAQIPPSQTDAAERLLIQFLKGEVNQPLLIWNQWLTMTGANIWTRIWVAVLAVGVPTSGLGIYWGWRSLENAGLSPIRRLSLKLTAPGGTNFQGADLLGASFEQAELGITNFRGADLKNVNWYGGKKMEECRFDPGSHLTKLPIRTLVTTRIGKGQNFDHYDLRELNLQRVNLSESSLKNANLTDVQLAHANLANTNLQGAKLHQANLSQSNLSGANLIGTDLDQADLSHADLRAAILGRTSLHLANLRNACLTGACIENWKPSKGTDVQGIVCQFIYQRWIDGKGGDRVPSQGEFQPDEFAKFVHSYLYSIGVHHEQTCDPKAVVYTLHHLAAQYHKPIEVVGVAKTKKGVALKLQVDSEQAGQLHKDYYTRYAENLSLVWEERHAEGFNYEVLERQIAKLVASVQNVREPTYIKYLYNDRILIMGGEVSPKLSGIYSLQGRMRLTQLLTQFRHLISKTTKLYSEERAEIFEQIDRLEELGRNESVLFPGSAIEPLRILRSKLSALIPARLHPQGNHLLDQIVQIFSP